MVPFGVTLALKKDFETYKRVYLQSPVTINSAISRTAGYFNVLKARLSQELSAYLFKAERR